MTTYGYARVSTKEQNVSRQLDALLAFPLEERDIYVDYYSGASFSRPTYQRLLRLMAEGDVLVVTSIDRLGRNYKEILEQWQDLTRVRGVDIVVLDMPLLDTRTSDRDLTGTLIADIVLQLLSYVAQVERENIRQRQAEGIAAAKARGVRFGRPPRPLPENFPAVHRAWRSKKLTLKQAAKACEMPVGTFYSKAVQWETTAALPPGLDL